MIDNGTPRRNPTDYYELDRLLGEAETRLDGENLREAHVYLRQASVKVASMWGVVGGAELPEPARELISLTAAVQRNYGDPRLDGARFFVRDLQKLRDRFATERG